MSAQFLIDHKVISAAEAAYTDMVKYMPNATICVGIELWKHTHNEDPIIEFQLASDCGPRDDIGWAVAETRNANELPATVMELIKQAGITTVEQYIRTQAYKAKGGAA